MLEPKRLGLAWRHWLGSHYDDVLILLGALVLTVGLYLIALSFALIFLGAFLIVSGILLARLSVPAGGA